MTKGLLTPNIRHLAIIILIVLLIALLIALFWLFYRIYTHRALLQLETFQAKQRPHIWMYWENKPGKTRPPFLDLCIDTVYHHCSATFDIHLLDRTSTENFLPDLRPDLQTLDIPQKTDYIRIALLYKYGGIWLDVDTIVMRDLHPILNKLQHYDFVGFGCTGHICRNGKPRPSNQALAAKPHSLLMRGVLQRLNGLLDQKQANPSMKTKYFDYGKILLWKEIRKLQTTQNYTYYHYDSAYDGSRQANGRWLRPNQYLEKEVQLQNENRLFFIFLSYSNVKNLTDFAFQSRFQDFIHLPKEEILEQPVWISRMLRKSLA